MCRVENTIIYAGGEVILPVATIDRFDIDYGVWTSQALTELSLARKELACAAALDVVVFAGGISVAVSPNTDIYNNTLAKWTPGKPLSKARRNLSAVTWGTKLYFLGGFELTVSAGMLPLLCFARLHSLQCSIADCETWAPPECEFGSAILLSLLSKLQSSIFTMSSPKCGVQRRLPVAWDAICPPSLP